MDYKCWMESQENELSNTSNITTNDTAILSPYENFVYALKSKETIRQYPNRLE